jgi:hypothetical protein
MTDRAPRARARTGPKSGAGTRLVTQRDRELLAFVAEHRLVLAGHAQALLGVSESVAYRRLGVLTANGLLEHTRVLHGQPGWYQITRSGLALIGSDLPPPRIDLRCYKHDIGVAWIWLAASRGAFGRVERMVSERAMRSGDAARTLATANGRLGDGRDPGFGVRLGGVGPRGAVRLHYPDLLLIGPRGGRVAIELELTAKGRRRLETILAGYGAEPSVAAVLYLSDKASIRREVQSSAARLGVSDRVRVQRFTSPVAASRPRAPQRARGPLTRGVRDPAARGALAR